MDLGRAWSISMSILCRHCSTQPGELSACNLITQFMTCFHGFRSNRRHRCNPTVTVTLWPLDDRLALQCKPRWNFEILQKEGWCGSNYVTRHYFYRSYSSLFLFHSLCFSRPRPTEAFQPSASKILEQRESFKWNFPIEIIGQRSSSDRNRTEIFQ